MTGPPITWRIGPGVALGCGHRTLVMGVVNVTPDSFSDGGRYLDPEAAVSRGISLSPWADVLDVGGESTRPGSDPVSAQEELDRVLPVVKRLAAETGSVISIDTRKPEVAAAAVQSGARIVNDVSAGRDPGIFDVVRDTGAGLVLMHMHGEPKTMQVDPLHDEVVRIVHEALAERLEAAVAAGIHPEQLAVDPGLGFGKTAEGSLRLMRDIDAFLDLGRPVVVGPSRKSFIGKAGRGLPVDQRLEGTIGAAAYLASRGAHVLRVHDTEPVSRAIEVVDAILRS
jgi:dihydropteroate synthase